MRGSGARWYDFYFKLISSSSKKWIKVGIKGYPNLLHWDWVSSVESLCSFVQLLDCFLGHWKLVCTLYPLEMYVMYVTS